MKRTPETQRAYEQRKLEVNLATYAFEDEKVISENEYYKIVENSYPYEDTAVHHMLVPKHLRLDALLTRIVEGSLKLDYDCVVLNMDSSTVFKPHVHLIKCK